MNQEVESRYEVTRIRIERFVIFTEKLVRGRERVTTQCEYSEVVREKLSYTRRRVECL